MRKSRLAGMAVVTTDGQEAEKMCPSGFSRGRKGKGHLGCALKIRRNATEYARKP